MYTLSILKSLLLSVKVNEVLNELSGRLCSEHCPCALISGPHTATRDRWSRRFALRSPSTVCERGTSRGNWVLLTFHWC